MTLSEIGRLVRERREALGLSQERLACLAGLSRATVNQLETGTLVDLGVSKLANLLDLVGLGLEAAPREASRRGLQAASKTASVSYRSQLDANQPAVAPISMGLHRRSKDIDIFVPNPQYLGYVSPRLSEGAETIASDYVEAAGFVKLICAEGEIDFVVSENLTDHPVRLVAGHRARTRFLAKPSSTP